MRGACAAESALDDLPLCLELISIFDNLTSHRRPAPIPPQLHPACVGVLLHAVHSCSAPRRPVVYRLSPVLRQWCSFACACGLLLSEASGACEQLFQAVPGSWSRFCVIDNPHRHQDPRNDHCGSPPTHGWLFIPPSAPALEPGLWRSYEILEIIRDPAPLMDSDRASTDPVGRGRQRVRVASVKTAGEGINCSFQL